MKKDEFVDRYGIVGYERQMKRVRDWRADHPENTENWYKQIRDWHVAHPRKTIKQMEKDNFIKEYSSEAYEKMEKQARVWMRANPVKLGEKEDNSYFRKLICDFVGLGRMRKRVTGKYGYIWRKYIRIIAPLSRLYYLWLPETDNCKCIALVERNQRQYAFKDVIHIPRRGLITKFLISKGLFSKYLTRKFKRPIPLLTEVVLYEGRK